MVTKGCIQRKMEDKGNIHKDIDIRIKSEPPKSHNKKKLKNGAELREKKSSKFGGAEF